jgi:D-alanyl-D-alanine carboxypeptidase
MPLFLKRLCLQAALFVGFFVVFTVFALPVHAKGNPRYASLVMDADTGQILHQRHADKKLHPASLTKVMTLLMAFEALEQNRMDLNQKIMISKHAAKIVPSKIGIPAGGSIRVEDAIYALVTKSANDIAAAMAEHIGGTEENFAKMMTRRAQQLGMSNSVFKNASGLHNPQQVSTARDMAKMAHYVITQYPHYYAYFSTQNFSFKGKNYHNHNRMLGKYKGMDGMKTGFTQPSGFNLIASAVQNNRRLIGVVFGGRTAQSRNDHMKELLDQSFRQISNQPLLVAKHTPMQAPPIALANAAADVPVPGRKPGSQPVTALAALNSVMPAAGTAMLEHASNPSKWTLLNPAMQAGAFSEMIGQGDYDPANSKRIETGLIAIAAHKGEKLPRMLAAADMREPASGQTLKLANRAPSQPAPAPQMQATPAFASHNINDSWGIQIGAFSSRAASDQAIHVAKSKLPVEYASAQPIIAPLKTPQGYIFRARLSGLTARDAQRACGSLLKECLILAPNAY